ncbi:MAG: VWA domain-containing protein [Anaerolineae bacterium]|nr:VWA domain-containing protein [Anaerolineae bacterium]
MRRVKFTFLGLLTLAVTLIIATSTLALNVQPTCGCLPPLQQTFASGVYIKSHRVSVTIDNQLAVTKIEQVFVNESGRLAEGTYLFPLPVGAAVSNLTMYINGVPIQAQILDAKQAQQIYTEIVRRMRDPALLQYVGRSAIQANVFPIPPNEQRKIEITYSQIVTADNGLINYTYPLKTDYASPLPVQQVSVSVDVTSKAPISTIYSPSPLVAISRTDDNHFRAGFETGNFRAADDFSIYYGVASSEINANLLTYRASATEDGYFMLMITPPTKVDSNRVIPKDVIVVLDQSGSMQGAKWTQARAAVSYVLKRLNPQDRFNVVVFSTGYRVYAKSLQSVSEADKAAQWVNGLEAQGGTDINGALTTALSMVDRDRQTTVMFLTDGLPTEGVTNAKDILANIQKGATPNLRIFAFGVGDDVDTYLLDSLSSGYRGVSVYVRPKEDIEQKVSSLYNKITAPVLTALKLDFGDAIAEDMYPAEPLPDLFAGSQLVVVGRFRNKATATVTLTGQIDGKPQTYTYSNLDFPENAGGQPFIARLWATRKIGYLLNQIRLNGEKQEWVDTIVRLSIRYGIITPYTSYLIQEDDIRLQGGDAGGAPVPGTPMPVQPRTAGSGATNGNQPAPSSGAAAVDEAEKSNAQAGADTVMAAPTAAAPAQSPKDKAPGKGTGSANEPIKQVNDRTFMLRGGIWTDTLYTDKMKLVPVIFLSDDYFKLLDAHPEIKDYLAIGDHVVIVIGDTAYEIKPQ